MQEAKIAEAQATLDSALVDQNEAEGTIAEARSAIVDWKKALSVAKTMKMEAEGNVLLARATLARLGVTAGSGGPARPGQHSELRQAVMRVLSGAPSGMTVDEVLAAVKAEGIELAGTNPRANLNAYLSRWDGIESKGRGVWGVPQVEEKQPDGIPAFLITEPTPPGTSLPEEFPGREALYEAGIVNLESLQGKTHDQLRRIKGIGAEVAREILKALEA